MRRDKREPNPVRLSQKFLWLVLFIKMFIFALLALFLLFILLGFIFRLVG